MSNRSILSDLFSLACLVPPLREVSSLHYKYIYVSIYIYIHTHTGILIASTHSYMKHTLKQTHTQTHIHSNKNPTTLIDSLSVCLTA